MVNANPSKSQLKGSLLRVCIVVPSRADCRLGFWVSIISQVDDVYAKQAYVSLIWVKNSSK
jgi:hypothetical protein